MAKRRKNSNSGILMIILAILLPFVAVLLKKGLGKTFLINVILCIIGYLPGIIHGVYVVTR